jgi:spermidine synthase
MSEKKNTGKTRQSAPRHSVDISEEAGVRYLHFGSDWVQGAMRVARPWSLELDYTREMMAGLLLRDVPQWPRSALLIGLGAGSLAKFIYRHLAECRSTVVEINPQVNYIARQYFKLPDDPARLAVVIGDGADYMTAGGRTFDYILVDGFDADARSGVLDTLPFYQACRSRLSENGLLCVNLLGRNKGFAASVARLHEAFAGRCVVFPPCASGNTIAFASGGAPVATTLDAMQEKALQLKQATRLDLLPTLKRLRQEIALAGQHSGAAAPGGILKI